MMGDGDGVIEIDPELYMKCRLCIEVKGKFQIPPNLQEKIKYAFDIDVKMFDGFSQIICDECRNLVNKFCDVKKQFLANQEVLLKKLPQRQTNVQKQEVVKKRRIVYDESDSEVEETKKKKRKTKKKVIESSDEEYVPSDTSVHSELSESSSFAQFAEEEEEEEENKCDLEAVPTSNWKDRFKRCYVCRYCNKRLSFKNSMSDHVRSHETLRRKNRKLTKLHCSVSVDRIDDGSNLTGNNDVVVLSTDVLLSNVTNPDFFVVYSPAFLNSRKASNDKNNTIDCEGVHDKNITQKLFKCIDVTSDEDTETQNPKIKKRIRLQSTLCDDEKMTEADNSDSHDTNTEGTVNTCTENSSEGTDSKLVKKSNIFPQVDYEAIKRIVSACTENDKEKSKKRKLQGPSENKLASDFLNSKVLSIGRKLMYKHGYSSIGLLKYLEQKRLQIEWKDTASRTKTELTGKDSMYIRIQTKLMERRELGNFALFVECIDNVDQNTETTAEKELRFTTKAVPKSNVDKKVVVELVKVSPNCKKISLPTIKSPQSLINKNVLLPVTDAPLCQVTDAPLYQVTDAPLLPALPNTTLIKTSCATPVSVVHQPNDNANVPQYLKVLNANPVANPKKIVKKNFYELMGNLKKNNVTYMETTIASTDHDYTSNAICLDSDDEDIPNSVPAAQTQNIDEKVFSPAQVNTNSSYSPGSDHPTSFLIKNTNVSCIPIITSTESLANTANEVPRIKCKPVSELMAAKNEQRTQSVIIQSNPINKPKKSSNATKRLQQIAPKKIPPNCVLLHTVELPYTLTNKPFEYFGKLLGMHALLLIDTLVPQQFDFALLARFKLEVSQNPVSVMLYLSLETYYSNFRICVKNEKMEHMNVHNMLALWQWEILNAFNQETVVAKIKENARKKDHTNNTYTNLFLTILGSIQLVTPPEKA